MSALNFLKVFQKQESYKKWFSQTKSWIRSNRSELEAQGLSKYVGFALTEDIATRLGKQAEFNALVTKFKKEAKRRGPYIIDDGVNPLSIVFPRVSFESGIASILNKYLGMGTADTATSMSLVKGHVVGIATGGLIGVKESLVSSKATAGLSPEEVKGATEFIDIIIEHLTQLDLDSSKFKDLTKSNVLAKYDKSSRHFLVELQVKADNDESAKLVQAISGRTINATTGIRGVFTPGGGAQKALKGLLEKLAEQGVGKDTLVNLESSPSLKALIEDEIVSELSGKAKKLRNKYSDIFSIGDISTSVTVGREQQKQDIQKTKQQLQELKRQILRNNTGQFASLTSIQNLINNKLAEQIRKNMGKGNARAVLNYRTGRFANSAQVKQLTMNRDGSVSAFYSYMKNPYQTFEPGFKQGFPESRDPRLLIGKSIREIAAEAISNRMKAISV